jgi:3-oxoacyl-[acyl-carrier protein] reductase
MKALSFDTQVAIVTGAGRGIGAAAASLFARHGCAVVVSDIDANAAEGVRRDIVAAGGRASAFAGDVTDDGFPDALIAHTLASFGGLNHIVNNAGFCWDAMVHKMDDDAWDAVVACHGRAPFRLLRAAAPHLRGPAKAELDAGLPLSARSVINVSSTSGLHGNAGQANYAFAKAGLVGLTKTIAREWGPLGIRCNAVAFGLISTRLTGAAGAGGSARVGERDVPQGLQPESLKAFDFERGMAKQLIPLGRAGTVEEAAGGIVLLASPLASYITGHVLEVTGGYGM